MRRGMVLAIAVTALLVTPAPALATFPGDNGKIAYYTAWTGPHTYFTPPDVWTVNPDGTDPVRHTTDESSSVPVWSPNGKKIAFRKYLTENDLDTEIYTMNADGSVVTDLTNSPGDDWQAAWSPDGKKIAFVSNRDEPDAYNCYSTSGICNWEIYVMNSDGTGLRRLTDSPNIDTDPSWSPDGTKIVFSTYRHEADPLNCYRTACNYEIYTTGADGGGLSRLTVDPHQDRYPQWSPRGDQILFLRKAGGSYYDPDHLYVTGTDGVGEHRLVDGLYNEDQATWSPDGNRIVFESNTQIHVVNRDGSGHDVLVNDIVSDPNDPNYYVAIYNRDPVWSPDGTQIAFSHDECPYYCDYSRLQTINADGSGGRTTVAGNAAVSPDWQRVPNQPPVCTSAAATPSSLSRHGFQTVTLAGATDPDGDAVTIAIDGVTQDEPVGRRPDARTGTNSSQVDLRGLRWNKGDGRVYRIAFTASDGTDDCTGVATVEVRRKKKQPAADSAPPSYDSFGQR
jgi:Tol biopolymer transport system component